MAHTDQTHRDQPNLFDWAHTAKSVQQGRESRNETFREIAGRLPKQRRLWYARIVAAGVRGVTLDEMSIQSGEPAHDFSGRVTELVHQHKVVRTKVTRLTRKGRPARVVVADRFYKEFLQHQAESEAMTVKQASACELPDAITNTETPVDQNGRSIADGRLYQVSDGRRTWIGSVREDEQNEFWFRVRGTDHWQPVNQMDAAARWEWVDS